MSLPRSLWRATAAVGCAIAITACGSSGGQQSSQPPAGSNQSASLVKFAECMRSHGVSGFPDPSTSQGPNSFGIDSYNFNLPSNLSLQSPTYVSANKICGEMIGGGSAQTPAFLAKARRAALAHAVCMRRHGVPSFPDPTVGGGSGGITVTSGGGGSNPRSPAFKQAQRVCQPH